MDYILNIRALTLGDGTVDYDQQVIEASCGVCGMPFSNQDDEIEGRDLNEAWKRHQREVHGMDVR
jgi:hypothetical protein